MRVSTHRQRYSSTTASNTSQFFLRVTGWPEPIGETAYGYLPFRMASSLHPVLLGERGTSPWEKRLFPPHSGPQLRTRRTVLDS